MAPDEHGRRAECSAGDIALWLERALVAAGLVLGLSWLLATAQMCFYASLPVPRAVERVVQPGEWVAKLEAPSVALSATVIEGSSDDVLARAAGHIEQTAWPGERGNVGIAGHRDSTFRAVRNLKPGDVLRLTDTNGSYEYRIDRAFIVNPEDVYVLDPSEEPMLTLVTCYPFTFIGHAPTLHRARDPGGGA